jgi:SAM-dependent methyltransferase
VFDNFYHERNSKLSKFITDFMGIQKLYMKPVLDLGCGYAGISAELHKLGADITAVDARQEHLQAVVKKFKNIKVVRANLEEEWPFKGKKFALVLDLGLICHLADFKKHLIEVCACTDNLFLETAVCDDEGDKCFSLKEFKNNYDKSFSGEACRPSAAAIEKVLIERGMKFKRIDDRRFNNGQFVYDWAVKNTGDTSIYNRRLWFCNRVGNASPKFKKLVVVEENVLPPVRLPEITIENRQPNIIANEGQKVELPKIHLRTMETTICLGIGDNLVVRLMLDTIKHNYSSIKISHDKAVLRNFRNNDPQYAAFMKELGTLLFSDAPYQLVDTQFAPFNTNRTLIDFNIKAKKPDIDHLLCKGDPLDIGEYIVLTTKVRGLHINTFNAMLPTFKNALIDLSKRYKVVVMGERVVEQSREYKNNPTIYGIYDQVVPFLPKDRILDLTVPALGIKTPSLANIQKDCVIMKNSKAVISFGIGGNLWIAACVANVIGYRLDNDRNTDILACPTFDTMFLTKDQRAFFDKLKSI